MENLYNFTPENYLLIALVVIFSGFLRGFIGFGSGLLMIPILSYFYSPVFAMVFNIVIEIPATIYLTFVGIKKANLKIHRKWYTSLILIIFTGDYGRVKFLPDNRLLFGILILFENIFHKMFSFLKIDKSLNFKLNLIIKP